MTDITLEGTINPPPAPSMIKNVENDISNKLTVPLVSRSCVFFSLWLRYERAHFRITAGRNDCQTTMISRSRLLVSVLPTPGPASHPGLADQALAPKTSILAEPPRPHLETGTNLR